MMIKKLFLLLNLTMFLLLVNLPLSKVIAQKQKANTKRTENVMVTGTQDREYWCNLLYKIASPVIENLAAGTLKKNMPLEKAQGYGLNVEKVTYLEVVGRTMAGVAPWLALPDDDTKEAVLRKQLRTSLLTGLKNAVDPGSADYLNFRTEHQPIVDAAFLAQAFLRAPQALWEQLEQLTKKRFIEEVK